MGKEIIINAEKDQTRIAIVEGGELAELYFETTENERTLGDIYLGALTSEGFTASIQPLGGFRDLVIAGEGGFFTTSGGVRGAMLRAYDKATGREVGAVYMPAPQSGSPMTYAVNGRQFLVIAVSANDYPGELIAYALPQRQAR